jgi:hypothetical protein
VEEAQRTTGQVVSRVLATAQGRVRIPSLKRLTQKIRVRAGVPASLPADRASIILPDEYCSYEFLPGHNELFLLGDGGEGDPDRILIFGRESVREWIGLVPNIYVDGTFSLAPALFEQLFVILAELPGAVVPICYALLPNKREDTYKRMVDLLRQEWPDFNPTAISMDFERGLINAFRSSFSGAAIQGCLFHLVKNVKRRLTDEGLCRRYLQDPDDDYEGTASEPQRVQRGAHKKTSRRSLPHQ